MSSYRGHFSELSPSDQADIASWSEPEDAACPLCGSSACGCDDADFFEILAEQEVYSDE